MHQTARARAASLVALALLLAAATTTLSAEIIQAVLVKVNGEILTKTDFEERQVLALRARGIQPTDDAAMKKILADITPTVLVETIDEMLLVQRGKELGYKMTDEDFNRVVTRIRNDNKLESDAAFEAALKQEGMTMADLRVSMEKQMLVSRVQQAEVMGKISITEEEARKYHTDHLKDFTKPGQVTIREIQVSVPKSDRGVNVGLDDEARSKAEGARKRIAGGEAFEQVAAEVSTSGSKANGGLVGPLNPAELTPAFQELLRGLKPGDVSDVIRTNNGYQIIKLESQTPDLVMTPEEAHDRITDAIFEEKRLVELKKYLEKQRAQAIIEWKNDELKKVWQSKVGTPEVKPAETAPATPGTH